MFFKDFISPLAIMDDLVANSRDEALLAMIDFLIARSVIPKEIRDGLLKVLIQREEITSTAIGGGVAVPHAKHPAIAKLTGLVARCRSGLVFKPSQDGKNGNTETKFGNVHVNEPVYVFVMLLSNQQLIHEHLLAISYVGKFFRQPEIVDLIRNARDDKDIWQFFLDCDSRVV